MDLQSVFTKKSKGSETLANLIVDTHEQSSWYFITQASLDLKLGKYSFKNGGKPFPLHSPTCKHVVLCPLGFEWIPACAGMTKEGRIWLVGFAHPTIMVWMVVCGRVRTSAKAEYLRKPDPTLPFILVTTPLYKSWFRNKK